MVVLLHMQIATTINSTRTLLLTGKQVSTLLNITECIEAVEGMFNLYGKGEALPPGILGIHLANGGFHIKAGTLNLGRHYFVAKTNANFPNNKKLHDLPTIQGVVAVFDGENGRLLSLMDSIEITILRTGTATAVAAKYLARPESKTVTICGCGNQGKISLQALSPIFNLEKVFAFDIDNQIALAFSKEMAQALSIPVIATDNIGEAARKSDLIVTCTSSKQSFLKLADIVQGTFIAAVGADSEDKQELEPEILKAGKVVVDVIEQCAAIGELHHAINKGLLSRENVHATLGEVVAGKKPGRSSKEEIIIFDSTGMALQDVAAAALVYEKALEKGIGLKLNFAD